VDKLLQKTQFYIFISASNQYQNRLHQRTCDPFLTAGLLVRIVVSMDEWHARYHARLHHVLLIRDIPLLGHGDIYLSVHETQL